MNPHSRRTIPGFWAVPLVLMAGCSGVNNRTYASPNGDRLGASAGQSPRNARGRSPKVEVKVGAPAPIEPGDFAAGR